MEWFGYISLLGLLGSAAVFLLFGKKIMRYIIRNYVVGPRHKQRESMFRAAPQSVQCVLFLGDSLTEGACWDEFFQDLRILNRGIGGDTTEGVLGRLDEVIRHKPVKIFLCIGTNDIAFGTPIPQIVTNYRTILETLRAELPETRVYVQSLLPVGRNVPFGHTNNKIIPLNEELIKLCREMNLPYIDLHKYFTDDQGFLKEELSNDKLHLLGEGYLIWKDIIHDTVYDAIS
jgi:lysophospholipase L1-like esterase